MIKPSIGRVVLVTRPGSPTDQHEPALVTYVHSDRLINVGGFDRDGNPFSATLVPLLQDADKPEKNVIYAEWMLYQKEQAKAAQDRFNALRPKPLT